MCSHGFVSSLFQRSDTDAGGAGIVRRTRLISWGYAVYFFCLVETQASHVPHLEWLRVDTLEEAGIHARRTLNQHLMPIAAHIDADSEKLDTVRPGNPEAPIQVLSADM